jgi:NAD(P)-dependent dehydrogenase (short-subunit alcohol dehydrogenase family)
LVSVSNTPCGATKFSGSEATVTRVPEFEARSVIVTGAASGIGRRTAEVLAGAGRHVLATDRDPIAWASGYPSIRTLRGDISDDPFVASLTSTAAEGTGFQAIIHCAGVNDARGLETTPEEWGQTIAVNLSSCFLLMKHSFPHLKSHGGGAMVTISSVAGLNGGTNCGPAYAAAKSGIHGLTKWAARRYAADKIRVNAIAPGLIATPMNPDAERLGANVPIGRAGEPGDIAGLATYLISEAGSFVTGQIWSPNGGSYI